MRKIGWILVAAAAMAGCGGSTGGGYVVENAPPPPPKPVEAPKTPDAWRDHRGDHVQLGKKFRLAARPIAVDGPNIVIALNKVDWSTLTTPSGKEIKEGAASVTVLRGEEAATALIPQGDNKLVHGARIEVFAAGEEYNKQRMTYDPWVELQVTVDP